MVLQEVFQIRGEFMSKRSNGGNNNNWLDTHEALVRISWCYYKLGMTQSEIAKKFSTNRVKIMKILERALKENVVEIRIKDPYVNLLDTENALNEKFGLKDSVVVPIDTDDKNIISKQLGMAASQYVSTIMRNGDILGIGWGESVSNTIKNLSLDHLEDFYIVSLSGGLLPLIGDATFFSRYSRHFKILPTPLLLSNELVQKDIFMEPEVRDIFNMWSLTTHLIVGIGALNADATILKRGYFKDIHFTLLKQREAVGDILGQYFDENGKLIDFEMSKAIVSFDIANLKEKQNVIAVAGGGEKVKAIKAAIRGDYVKTLITDERTANALLKDSE